MMHASSRRAFATLLVLWVVAIAAVLIVSIQWTSFQQAAAGREAFARTRAYWAARGGIEAIIARLEFETQAADIADAYRVQDAMAEVAEARLDGAWYRILHESPSGPVLGPADAHAKININTMTAEGLLLLPYMTEDIADAILDWIDADEDTNPLGAEAGQYAMLPYPYEPRNAPFRTLAELELVLGVDPFYVRGEDWNLNGILDPEEDDGDASWPPDNRDGVLDAEWSALITADSRGGGLAASGLAKLDLRATDATELVARVGVTSQQADVILTYVDTGITSLRDFVTTALNNLRDPTTGQRIDQRAQGLSREQLALLLDETTVEDPTASSGPGKININTCDAEVFEYIAGLDPSISDAIIAERDARATGFLSMADLLDVPSMSQNQLAALLNIFDVRSNVYVATSRGVDSRTGYEVEIHAVIDRSTLPASILEIRVR